MLLVLVVQPLSLVAAEPVYSYEQVAASESSADFPLLEPQVHAPSNSADDSSSSKWNQQIAIEIPSQQQLDALVLDSPAMLFLRTRHMQSLFALDDATRTTSAHIDGRGRANRPRGISITRGLPFTSHKADPALRFDQMAMDDRALQFAPEQLHMGTLSTCAPMLWLVEIINSNAHLGLRLDDVEFTRGGFEVLTNVQGIVLEPTGRLRVQFLFTPSFPDDRFEAFMRVFTSSGQFALRIMANVELHEFGLTGIRAIIPVATDLTTTLVMTNPFNDVLRVLDVFSRDAIGTFSMPEGVTAISPPARAQPGGTRTGAWDIPPSERRRIVDYTFHSKHVGVFFTYIRMVTSHNKQQQLAIPMVIEVVPEGLHFEPTEVHLGVLTAYDRLRQVDVHLFNAASVPIKIYSVHVDEATNMDIIVQLNGPIVIPPRTRIRHAINVRAAALAKREYTGEENDNVTECFATLSMRTNHSSVFNATMDIKGVWLKGTLAYNFNETLVGVVGSLYEAFNGGGGDDYYEDEDNDELQLDTRLLTTATFLNGSLTGVHAGATVLRSLKLQNLYNISLDLERVWVSPYRTTGGEIVSTIVHVDSFERGPAKSGELWPGEIRLRVTPPRFDDLFAPRVLPVNVETNLMVHRVNLHFFYGFLQVKTRFQWLNHSQAGYQPATKAKGKKPPKKCQLVTDLNSDSKQSRDSDGNVKLCRTFVLELGKVSAHDVRTKALNLTNVNPIPVDIKVASLIKSELFDLTITSTLSKAHQASAEVAAIGQQYADQAANSSQLNIISSLRAYTNPKAKNFKLHEEIVIPPGYDFTLELGLQVGQEFGAFTKYLLTLETPFEFLHVYARFESVAGAIWPLVTDVQLPPMFPGSTAFVDLHYESTFAHNVATDSVHVPRSLVQVLTTNTYIEAGRAHSGFSFLFSPSYNDLCARSKYLADCLIPEIAEPTLGITLSNFGDDVTDEDLTQIGRRERAWGAIARPGAANYTVTAVVQLRTTIMDTDKVSLTAPLVRPSVTTLDAVLDFNLTKVLQRQMMTVKVRNPSSISIDMELAVSRHDRALFYNCSSGKDRNDDASEAACLREWEALVRQGVEDAQQSVAPFFVSRRLVRVPWGQEAELGPVYFFPSHALEVDTTLFVRTELTHLEPVQLLARSGQGALDLRVLVDQQERDSRLVHEMYEWDVDGKYNRAKNSEENPAIHFKMSPQSGPLVPVHPQQKDIELRNVGTYTLAVESVHLIYDQTAPLLRKTFTVSIEGVEPSHQAPQQSQSQASRAAAAAGNDGATLVAPGKSIRLRVVYKPNCYIAHIEQELVLVVDDQTIRVPLFADVRPSACFDCLRANVPVPVRALLLVTWRLAVLLAALVSFYSVYCGLSGIWGMYCLEMSLRSTGQHPLAAVNKVQAATEANGLQHEVTSRFLDELQAASFAPDSRGVQTPAVTKLLQARQKKKNLSAAMKKQLAEDNSTAVEGEAVQKTPARAPVAPIAAPANIPQRLEQTVKPTVSTGSPFPDTVSPATFKPLVERASSPPIKPAPPVVATAAAPVRPTVSSSPVQAVADTIASQKRSVKPKTAQSKSLSPLRTESSSKVQVPVFVPSPVAAQSTVTHEELVAEPVVSVDDATVRLERKVAPKAKKVARPSRIKRPNQAAARPPLDLSIAVEATGFCIDSPEPMDDALASSMGSTSTTVSFDSEDLKLSPAKTKPESADDFFLSMTFEAPFSSFGAIGKRRTASPQPQQRGFSSDNQEDNDTVLVERFGLSGGLNNNTRAAGTNGVAPEPSASRDALDAVEDDDWSDLYFDSIRSEIGRLVAGSDNGNTTSNRGFGALHAHQSGSNALGFNLQHPLDQTDKASVASVTPATQKKKTPPGFSPADANPLESIAAFERLRSASPAPAPTPTAPASAALSSSTGSSSSSRFAFASRLSLFGPTSSSSPFGLDQSGALDQTGALGKDEKAPTSSGSKALRRGAASASAHDDEWGSGAPLLRVKGSRTTGQSSRSGRNALASLGGVELPSQSAYTASLQ